VRRPISRRGCRPPGGSSTATGASAMRSRTGRTPRAKQATRAREAGRGPPRSPSSRATRTTWDASETHVFSENARSDGRHIDWLNISPRPGGVFLSPGKPSVFARSHEHARDVRHRRHPSIVKSASDVTIVRRSRSGNDTNLIELPPKYCRWCGKHTPPPLPRHRQTRIARTEAHRLGREWRVEPQEQNSVARANLARTRPSERPPVRRAGRLARAATRMVEERRVSIEPGADLEVGAPPQRPRLSEDTTCCTRRTQTTTSGDEGDRPRGRRRAYDTEDFD